MITVRFPVVLTSVVPSASVKGCQMPALERRRVMTRGLYRAGV